MQRREFLTAAAVTTLAASNASLLAAPKADKPNILWITSEDNGQEMGCYGDTFATTPNLDTLAERSLRFNLAFASAPVCAPARSTIISGCYASSLGSQHMRSHAKLPADLKLFPFYLRQAGYYTTNNSKQDYNFACPKGVWDESSKNATWKKRRKGQPFFCVHNYTESHESKIRLTHKPIHDPKKVTVPPYHPDTPTVRTDWARYYDSVTVMDKRAGALLKQLEADGLADSTIIVYFGDHGSGMPRHKRWLHDSGLKVPMLVHVPDKYKSQLNDLPQVGVTDRMVAFVDLAPTMLSLAGLKAKAFHQGNAFLGKHAAKPQKYVFGFRDRMDERVDMSRTVRTKQYRYILNFFPHYPQGQHINYMFVTPTTREWKKMFDEGKLNDVQSKFWKPKPVEELYDCIADPYETKNLAADPKFKKIKEELKQAVMDWMVRIRDTGIYPEPMVHSASAKAGKTPKKFFSAMDEKEYRLVLNRALRWLPEYLGIRADESRSTTIIPAGEFWASEGLLNQALNASRENKKFVFMCRGIEKISSPSRRANYASVMIRAEIGDKGAAKCKAEAIATLKKMLASEDGFAVHRAAFAINHLPKAEMKAFGADILKVLNRKASGKNSPLAYGQRLSEHTAKVLGLKVPASQKYKPASEKGKKKKGRKKPE